MNKSKQPDLREIILENFKFAVQHYNPKRDIPQENILNCPSKVRKSALENFEKQKRRRQIALEHVKAKLDHPDLLSFLNDFFVRAVNSEIPEDAGEMIINPNSDIDLAYYSFMNADASDKEGLHYAAVVVLNDVSGFLRSKGP